MPHLIEEKAKSELKKILGPLKNSDVKTFDFFIRKRKRYIEVKGKGMPFEKIDFISLTNKQFHAIKKYDYEIYLVCNLKGKKPEIYKLNAKSLLKKKPRKVISYEWDRLKLKPLVKKI